MRIEFQFVIASFAVLRLTHLLNTEDGPWQIMARLHNLAGKGFCGEVLGLLLPPERLSRCAIRLLGGENLDGTPALVAGGLRSCNPAGTR